MSEFDLIIARDLRHLLESLAERPDSRIVAGATDFIPLVGAGKWKPRRVIDITRVQELHFIRRMPGWLCLGPLTTHGEAAESPCIKRIATALAEACASVADPLIRGRATLGGNLCTASPAADSVPAMLALGAELRLASLDGERRLPLEKFLIGPGKTALLPGEVLAEICLPVSPGPVGSGFFKLGRRRAMAISVANAAAWIRVDAGTIFDIRLALGSVAPTVVRCRKAEAALRGRRVIDIEARASEDGDWLGVVRDDISPIDDVRASGAYRRRVAAPLVQRMVAKALERAEIYR